MRKQMWIVFIISILVAACSPPTPLTTAPAPTPISSDADYRELTGRLLQLDGYGAINNFPKVSSEIFINKLPPDFSDVILPDNARLLGGIKRTVEGTVGVASSKFGELILDGTQPASEFQSDYKDKLIKAGWKVANEVSGSVFGGGFQPNVTTMPNMYCDAKDNWALTVTANTRESGITDIRLTVQDVSKSPSGGNYGPCSSFASSDVLQLANARLPILVAPQGSTLLPISASGASNYSSSEAMLDSEKSIGDLNDHFSLQIEKAGWTKKSSGKDTDFAWSMWAFKDGKGVEQYGLFWIAVVPGTKSQRQVFIQAGYGMH